MIEPKYVPPVFNVSAQSQHIEFSSQVFNKKSLPALPPLPLSSSDIFNSPSKHKEPRARNANISESFSRERSGSLAFWQDNMSSMFRKASVYNLASQRNNSLFEMNNMPQNIVDLLNSCTRETKGERRNSIILLSTNAAAELNYEPNKGIFVIFILFYIAITALKTMLNSPNSSQSLLNKRKRDDEDGDNTASTALALFESGDFYGFRKHSEEFPIVISIYFIYFHYRILLKIQ